VPENRQIRSLRLAVALVITGAALLIASAAALAAGHHPSARNPSARHPHRHRPVAPPLSAWLAGSVAYPQRAIVLVPPPHGPLAARAVSLRENGEPVNAFAVRPLSAGGPGDVGTVVAIDQSTSMGATGLAAAMKALHSVAASRAGAQQLGIITYDATPSRYLALTADPAAITRVLGSTPWTGTGSNPSGAATLGLQELAEAHLAAGVIIVISDGVGLAPGAAVDPALRSSAQAAHVPIVTVGLADGSATVASLRALAGQAPGPYVAATPADLAATLAAIEHQAQSDDVISWRSAAPPGQVASISLTVAGLSGRLTAQVTDPRPAPPAPPPASPVVVEPSRAPVSSATPAPARLGFSPSFARRGTLQRAPAFLAASSATTAAPTADPTPAPAPAVAPGFWGSSTSVLAVAAACGLLAALILLLILHRPSRRAVRLRVGSFVEAEPSEDEPLAAALTPRPTGPFAVLARSNWWTQFVEAVEVGRLTQTPGGLVKRWAGVGMVLAVLTTLVFGSVIVGFLCLIAWPFALRFYVRRSAARQQAKFRDTLPTYLQDLASTIRVGRSLVAGLTVLSENAEEPMRSELERAITDEALGRPIETSLEAVAKRMQSEDMDQVALIAALNRRSGSNIAEALDRVAEGARERADLRREVKALTAQAKMSSFVLTALPGVLLLGLSVISPKYSHPLFHTTLGLIALGSGTCLVLAGWKVMQKITQVEA
jgi:tight adherence protein B